MAIHIAPAERKSAPHTTKPERDVSPSGGVHPIVITISLAATVWFLAATWLSFARDPEVDLDLAIATLFFVIFFSLFLSTASYASKDERWRHPARGFAVFLRSNNVAIDGGRMRGRDVLIEVALIPVALAVAATLIGLAWVLVG